MDDYLAKGVGIAILVTIGSLIVYASRKFDVPLKRIYWIGGISYCVGVTLMYKDNVEAGSVFLVVGTSIGFYWLFIDMRSRPQKRKSAPIETSFSYRLGQRLGRWVSRGKGKSSITNSLQGPKISK